MDPAWGAGKTPQFDENMVKEYLSGNWMAGRSEFGKKMKSQREEFEEREATLAKYSVNYTPRVWVDPMNSPENMARYNRIKNQEKEERAAKREEVEKKLLKKAEAEATKELAAGAAPAPGAVVVLELADGGGALAAKFRINVPAAWGNKPVAVLLPVFARLFSKKHPQSPPLDSDTLELVDPAFPEAALVGRSVGAALADRPEVTFLVRERARQGCSYDIEDDDAAEVPARTRTAAASAPAPAPAPGSRSARVPHSEADPWDQDAVPSVPRPRADGPLSAQTSADAAPSIAAGVAREHFWREGDSSDDGDDFVTGGRE